MTNEEIKQKIKEQRLLHYEVAEYLKISPYSLSIWFRKPLTNEQQKKILEAIKYLTKRK